MRLAPPALFRDMLALSLLLILQTGKQSVANEKTQKRLAMYCGENFEWRTEATDSGFSLSLIERNNGFVYI